MQIRLTLLLEEQPEGRYTVTCKELPELLTECDLSLHDMYANVKDVFDAVVELYKYRKRPLPKSIFRSGEDIYKNNKPMIETVVALNEVSSSSQKTKTTWL